MSTTSRLSNFKGDGWTLCTSVLVTTEMRRRLQKPILVADHPRQATAVVQEGWQQPEQSKAGAADASRAAGHLPFGRMAGHWEGDPEQAPGSCQAWVQSEGLKSNSTQNPT